MESRRQTEDSGESGQNDLEKQGDNRDVNPSKPINDDVKSDGIKDMDTATMEPSDELHTKREKPSGALSQAQKRLQGLGNMFLSDRNLTSLQLRKLNVNSSLLARNMIESSSVLTDDASNGSTTKSLHGSSTGLLQRICLRPHFTIREQLFRSFGTINAVTTLSVVIVCILTALLAGENIKDTNEMSFKTLERESQVRSARYVARSIYQSFLLDDEVNTLREVAMDRFQGYPNPSDTEVPFLDMETKTRIYPVIGSPVPFDWQLTPNAQADNYEEHFQNRSFWKDHLDRVSTLHAGFMMQGTCDPTITDRNHPAYWPVCTDKNNDILLGGIVAPSPITEQIHRKGSDIVPVMKAIFESTKQIRDIGVYFANDGSGASIVYPQSMINGTSTYISAGCDWMNENNPFDPSRTIGTQDMINRCRRKGVEVSYRAFNVLETEWCARQALNPSELVAIIDLDDFDGKKSFFLRLGRAIYDRQTNQFIGCSHVSVSLLEILDKLEEASRITEESEVTLVTFDESGTVIASSAAGVTNQEQSIHDIGLGLDEISYKKLYELVDYEKEWDPASVEMKYESYQAGDDRYLISVYPIPPVPEVFDPSYRPLAFVISSTSIEEIFAVVTNTNEEVNDRVRGLIVFSVVAGVVGLLISTVIIYLMANKLTAPLISMNNTASDIVSSFGNPSDAEGDQIASVTQKNKGGFLCRPWTELDEVVDDFNEMVSSFSGRMMATSQKGKFHEVLNEFHLREELKMIYQSRHGFKYDINNPKAATIDPEEETFINSGHNLIDGCDVADSPDGEGGDALRESGRFSPLLLWIIGLIVTPLLLSNILITVVVLRSISAEFSDSVDSAKAGFLNFQRKTLLVHARLRADTVSELTRKPTRDAYLLSRYSGWLLFEGLERADSFTEISTGIEECKAEEEGYLSCDYYTTEFVCDCAWEQKEFYLPFECLWYPDGSRHLQVPYWICESSGTSENGDRDITLFPNVSFSPETTEWWDDPFDVPGSESGANVSGHNSTYARLRSISALPLFQVLYNQATIQDKLIETLIAFEADGLLFGYSGCGTVRHTDLAYYSARKEDSMTRPELCPEGKYGYDPRCRTWYDDGRNLLLLNNTFLHVTAPYSFASASTLLFAQTATTPLVDPNTGEHVGQVLIDFFADPIYSELLNNTFLPTDEFPFVITTQTKGEADSVLAPGLQLNETAVPIAKQVLPFDYGCNNTRCLQNIGEFLKIVATMKAGESKDVEFMRSGSDANQERIHMAFAPVTVGSFQPLDSSNITRGVAVSEYLVYALALAEPEDAILEPFDPIKSTTEKQIRISIAVLSILIAAATLLVATISKHVAKSISEPMVYVMGLIQSINENKSSQPPSNRKWVNTSHEVTVLSETMEMLYACLRSANAAYYVGDLELAQNILVDALRLFKRLENKKAIGIASNNLGNVGLAMYLTMKVEKSTRTGSLSRKAVIRQGMSYYHEAIHLGEAAYDEFYKEQGWSPICLAFMQHLANRYFNRGLFLLTAKDEHKNPAELEKLGRRDLRIARDMDEEVVSYGEEVGWGSADRVENIFENTLSRARGYNMLIAQGYDDDWEVETLLDEAFSLLEKERKTPSSKLFSRMSYAARLQDLEIELIKYMTRNGDLTGAARVAVRMLYEDEYILLDAKSRALETLIAYIGPSLSIGDAEASRLKKELKGTLSTLVEASEDQTSQSMSNLNATAFISKRNIHSTRSIMADMGPGPGDTANWHFKHHGGRYLIMEDF